MYRATPASHLDASSTPSHANETATARIVKNIVMFGLGVTVRSIQDGSEHQHAHIPPSSIVRPSPDHEQDHGLQGEADAVGE